MSIERNLTGTKLEFSVIPNARIKINHRLESLNEFSKESPEHYQAYMLLNELERTINKGSVITELGIDTPETFIERSRELPQDNWQKSWYIRHSAADWIAEDLKSDINEDSKVTGALLAVFNGNINLTLSLQSELFELGVHIMETHSGQKRLFRLKRLVKKLFS